ncbi:MAG: CBS domain-containing protein [Flavobacteriales bacterium]|nr:CBS domain-containing protein [Flavobacteriales bacterium]MCB9166717.1 CBS domain-containing protein [Flavobacteriales bacterium]
MRASELITQRIPPLRPDDTVTRALDWMEEFKVEDLPVVEGGRLVGMVTDSALVDRNDARAAVRSVMDSVEIPFVRESQHIYDVMKLISGRGLSVVPVVDMTGVYLGAVNEHEALHRLAQVMNIHEPGSVVVLEMAQTDYSLHEIARIVEGNDARVLSAFSHTDPDSTLVEVTLKINREDISDILQSFERYEYKVTSTYQGSRFHDDLRDRYDELMRFIRM